MLVCIPKDRVVPFNKIQKNIIIDSVLSDVKFFDTEEEAKEVDYIPISVCVSIRSAYSNLVVAHTVKEIERHYITVTNIPNEVHFRGEDLLAFLSSLAITQAYDPSNPSVQQLMVSAKFIPIGILYLDENITYPYFYSQVVINDDNKESMKKLVKEGYKVIPIKDMKTKGSLKQITNELFEIKEQEHE